MVPTCVNNGGLPSLVRLDVVPRLNEEVQLSAGAVAALALWQPKVDELVTLLDPEGSAYRARLTTVAAASCTCLPLQRLPHPVESLVRLELYQAVPDQESFESALQTLTELGVNCISTMTTALSAAVVEFEAQSSSELILKAAKQCHRAMLPELFTGLTFEAALAQAASAELKLLLSGSEAPWSLVEGLGSVIPQSVAILVGPADGFSEEEVALTQALGFLPVSLGPRILSTATAAIVAATLVQGHLGDLR